MVINTILVFDVMITIIICWNAIDIYKMKKDLKLIKRIQDGEDVEEIRPLK